MKAARQRLLRNAAALVRHGHANVWDYTWDAYEAAINELEEAHRGNP